MRKSGRSLLLVVVVLVAAAGSGRAESGSPLLVRAGAVSAGLAHTVRSDERRRRQVLGLQRHGELGQGEGRPRRQLDTGRRLRPDQRRHRDRRGAAPHLRAHDGGGVKCWGSTAAASSGRHHRPTVRHAVDVAGLEQRRHRDRRGLTTTPAPLTSAGGVKCWGYNACGQLGDGTTTRRLTPVDVPGLTSGVAADRRGRLPAPARCTSARRRQVLGREHLRPARRRHDHRPLHAGRRRRPDAAASPRSPPAAPHLRAHERGRRQVLGLTTATASSATARPSTHGARRRHRPTSGVSHRGGRRPHLRAHERGRREVLGQQRHGELGNGTTIQHARRRSTSRA